MTEPSRWAGPHQQAWDAALATLREAGWRVVMTCSAAPVQLEGVLPCGEQFYFRSRHDEVLLAVGGEDPADRAPWERLASYGPPGGEVASYLPAQPGLDLLQDLSTQHWRDCRRARGLPGVPVHRDFWSLQLLSDQRIDDPAVGAQIMRTLLTVLPEFRPVRYGEIEPDAGRWTDDLVERLASIWPRAGMSFAFEGADGTQGSMASIAGNHMHSRVHLDAPGAGPDDDRALRFLTAVAGLTGGEFGLIHRFDQREAQRAARNGTLLSAQVFTVTSHDLKRGIPDIYWATLFGPGYVDMLGPERLRTAPAAKAELLPDGSALLQASTSSGDVLAPADPFGAAREAIIEHLGRNAFYDPLHPDARTITPAFGDTISRSLRRTDPAAVEARRRAGIE